MPPKLPENNTTTREYYTPNPTTDTASNEEIDWPSGDEGLKSSQEATKSSKTPSSLSKNPASAKSPSSSKKTPSKGKEVARESDEGGEGQGGGKDETPSPTPSDVILNADFRDVGKLAEENKRMMSEGIGVEERKARSEGIKDSLEEKREEKRKKTDGDGGEET